MSYESDECKLLIDESIHDYLHDDTENEMAVKDWFYDLRKQATKADDYESKAKAYDHIENLGKTELTSDDLYNDARNNDYAAGMLRVYEMVDYIIDDYESGEMNVKE